MSTGWRRAFATPHFLLLMDKSPSMAKSPSTFFLDCSDPAFWFGRRYATKDLAVRAASASGLELDNAGSRSALCRCVGWIFCTFGRFSLGAEHRFYCLFFLRSQERWCGGSLGRSAAFGLVCGTGKLH